MIMTFASKHILGIIVCQLRWQTMIPKKKKVDVYKRQIDNVYSTRRNFIGRLQRNPELRHIVNMV